MSLEQEINCSKIAYDWAKKTYNNRRFADGEPYYDPSLDGSFMSAVNFRGIKIAISSDGIGTKLPCCAIMSV